MSKYWMSCALVATFCLLTATKADAACRENDLGCFREGFLERGKQIDSLAREIALKDRLIDTQAQTIRTLTESNTEMSGVLKDTRAMLPKAERAWHEDPKLWFGGGVVAGILAVTVTAVVLHYTLH